MVSLCLKLKAVAAFLDVEKIKQMKGRQAHYTRSLKPCCHGDQPTRSPDISCVPTQETSRTVIGRRSTCRTALPCSRFLVPCSTILSPRSKAHQREICAGYCCCSPAPYVRPRELLEQSQPCAPLSRSPGNQLESSGCDVQWRTKHPKMPPDWGFAK